MKQIVTLTITSILVFAAAFAHGASPEILVDPAGYRDFPNLLHNRSFEAFAHVQRQHQPSVWSCRDNAGRDTEARARSGDCTMKLTGKGNASQTLTLLPNTDYVFRVFRRGTGDGLKLQAFADRNKPLGEVDAKGDSDEWREVTLNFRTPEKFRYITVTIASDLAEGKTARVDDPSLAPADGKAPTTPAPILETSGGTFDETTWVTLKTDLPGGTIRITIDGTEPSFFSMPADVPVRIANGCRLKAKVFHDGYRPGPAVEANFVIKRSIPADGVPHSPFRLGQPVEEWWKDHVYNSDSPNYVEKVGSPG